MASILATINGQAVLDLRITLRRGAAASMCEAVLPFESAPVAGAPVAIVLADDRASRKLEQFTAIDVQDMGDGRARVLCADARHFWQQHPVSLRVNVAAGDGRSLEPASTNMGRPHTLASALDLAFAQAAIAPPLHVAQATPGPIVAQGLCLNDFVARAAASCGWTFTINDQGEATFAQVEAELTEPPPQRLIQTAGGQPGAAHEQVVGGQALQLQRLTRWQPVLPGDGSKQFPAGEYFALDDMLAAWGINPDAARQAAWSEGGFEKLVATTAPGGAARLHLLRRDAFRLFRCLDTGGLPWVPVGGVSSDGTFSSPQLQAAGSRPRGQAPDAANGQALEPHGLVVVHTGFEIDVQRGLVRLPQPPYALGPGDATWQSRALVGPPLLRLTIARVSDLPPFRSGDGPALAAPHLVALYDGTEMLNRAALQSAAMQLARDMATTQATHLLAGAGSECALGACEQVEITAGKSGLLTRVLMRAPDRAVAQADPGHQAASEQAVAPLPGGLHQPINLWRSGPLVIKATGTAPETESALAAQVVARNPRTGVLELRKCGPLAFPFFVDSTDTSRHGRWFFVAGVQADSQGRLHVLASDDRHEPMDAEALCEVRRKRPGGLRGLLVSLGDEPVLMESGPLVSDARGKQPGECSNLVSDLEQAELSPRRRGGLQFLTVLVLSPAHQAERVGGGPGWVPALNLRDGETQNPALSGRGLFAEGDGHSLGRLTAHNQAGPVLADAQHCQKHLYGAATEDGLYREVAGHISTESFFKVPGDPVLDAPLRFYTDPFEGAPPPWPPYEAQIKYDANVDHRWNHARRPGAWRIQYRVPFLPEIPPTWRPRIKQPEPGPPIDEPRYPAMILPPESVQPAVSEFELWAPSHDWLPVPGTPDSGRDLPMRGPAISSEGWAAEVNGMPDPSLGGGCIFLPPGRPLTTAQIDQASRQTFLLLHPEVLLGFGLPHHGLGRLHSGWQVALQEGDLVFAAMDADGLPTEEPTLRIQGNAAVAGKLTVQGLIDPTGLELEPQSANPGGVAANTLWLDSADHDRAKMGSNKLAYLSEVPSISGLLAAANNLSDVGSKPTSLYNLLNGLTASIGNPGLTTKVGIIEGSTAVYATLQQVLDAISGLSATTPILSDVVPFTNGAGQAKAATPQKLLDLIHSTTAKTTLAANDEFALIDSAASNVAKRITFANVQTALAASDSVAGLIEYADQTEMEAGSSNVRAVTPGRQHFHPGHPKAWGYATVSGGTPTLQTSYNITSITDSAVGQITFTINNDFSTANWSAQGNVTKSGTGASNARFCNVESSGLAAGSVLLMCSGTASLADPAAWHFMGNGDI